MGTHDLCFEQKQENYQLFSPENYRFYTREKLLFIAWACFRNEKNTVQEKLSKTKQKTKLYYLVPPEANATFHLVPCKAIVAIKCYYHLKMYNRYESFSPQDELLNLFEYKTGTCKQ